MVNIMFQWLMTGMLSVLHPFFVSVIEINHNPKQAMVEISVRTFTEDMEKTLQKYTTAKVDLLNPPNKELLDKQINIYLAQKIKLKINGQAVTMHLLGHEIQKESIWTYFEVPKVNDMSTLEVDCSLLYDFEKTQSNIIHVKSKGKDKSFKLDFPNTITAFEF